MPKEILLDLYKSKNIVYPFKDPSVIIKIHDLIITYFGGTFGLIAEGSLNQAINEAIDLGDKTSHEETIINKAAGLLFNIIHGHPFVDGNKRTGLTITEMFLSLNGYEINDKEDNLYNLCLEIAAAYEKDSNELKRDIQKWLRKHIKKSTTNSSN